MSELVTVIVPVYNVEKYVARCLDSICQQSYENLEIIVVDDGATDGSGAICDEYAAKDARIQVIHQKNQGLSGARNTALDMMTGDYVTFVDSDDFLDEKTIELLYQAIKDEEADLAVCQPIECDETDRQIKAAPIVEAEDFEGLDKMKSFLTENKISTAAWGKLYLAELFEDVRYPIGKYHEDVFTTYQLVHKAKRVYVCDFDGYWYRQLGNSIMHTSFQLRHMDALEGCRERYAFYAEQYPSLEGLAWSTVTWTAAKCHERMIKASYRDKELEKQIQTVYRKRLPVFLKYSTCSMVTKLFVIVGAVHMGFAGWIYKKI